MNEVRRQTMFCVKCGRPAASAKRSIVPRCVEHKSGRSYEAWAYCGRCGKKLRVHRAEDGQWVVFCPDHRADILIR